MNRWKRIGIAVLALVLVQHLIILPMAWSQSAARTAPEEVTSTHRTAAGFANVLYVPSKVGFCIVGGATWLTIMVLSGGTGYNVATNVVRAGCGGDWLVYADDIRLRSSDPYGASAR
jgi:hypothetical protein